jgi:uncharacterized protein YqhQ
MMGLVIAIFVISSITWVTQWRRIRHRIRLNKAMRADREAAADPPELLL